MIKLKDILMESMKPHWSAVVLDDESRKLLIDKFADMIPDEWEVIAHHQTINPFELIDNKEVGRKVLLKVTDIGESDKALAVKVVGYSGKTKNAFPHVTIAIDRLNGAKPKDSNLIKEWKPVLEDIYLKGTIQNL